MNKLTLIALALILLTTAGCGPLQPATPTATAAPPDETSPPASPTTMTGDTADARTITLWLPPFLSPAEDNQASQILSQRLQEYQQQHPEIDVAVRIKAESGPGGLLQTLQAASTAAPATLPDIIALGPAGLNAAALKGLIQPFDDVFERPDEDEWYPHAVRASQIDSVFYGYPFASDGLVLAYRTASFDSPPLSWEQLIQSNRTFIFPAGDPEALFTISEYQHLGGDLSSEEGRPMLDPSILETVLTSYQAGMESGVLSQEISTYQTAEDSWQTLLNGTSHSALAPLSGYFRNQPNNSISVAPLPTPGGEGMGISRTWSWGLVSQDPVQQVAARDLIEWLTAPEFLGPWSEQLGLLPSTRAALEHWSDESAAPVATLLAGSLRARPSEESLATFGPPVHQAVTAVLSGALTPSAAALEASRQFENP